ncbi:MAG: DUF4956 domain-containing protein [Treponema sp.]|nr:DUF4956 domain-containing protein [Candidatus Treponema scatequi]
MNFSELFSVGAKDIEILFNIVVALVSGIIIVLGYNLSKQKKGVSKSFVATILLLPMVVVVVIPLIATDLKKALSLAGIFALVRFRSIPGDSKDIFYIFFTLAVGVAIALNYYLVAAVLILVVSVIFILVNRFMKFSDDQLLKITIPEDMNYNGAFDDIFAKYFTKAELSDVKTSNMGTLFIVSYSVHMKDEAQAKEMIDEIRTRNGNLNVVLQMDPELYMKL